jgi:hypothetical protein
MPATLRVARARIATRSVAGWGCGRGAKTQRMEIEQNNTARHSHTEHKEFPREKAKGNFTAKATKTDFQSHIFEAFVTLV